MFAAELGTGIGDNAIVASAVWAIKNHRGDTTLQECKDYLDWLQAHGKLSPDIISLIELTGDAALIALIRSQQ